MRLAIGSMLLSLTLLTNVPGAQEAPKPKELVWTHAFDLASRRFMELDFTKETQKFGVEAFKDNNNGKGLYISQTGSLAAAADGFLELKLPLTVKGPEWFNGLDLPARRAGEEKFETAKVHSMEVFRDPNTENWIYITDKGNIAVASAKAKAAGGDKRPKWLHSVDLSVRKGGVMDWKDAAKFGIEVYRDGTTGNLIYISDTGAIAVLPEAGDGKTESEGKTPEWVHGLDLKCRKHNEPEFSKDTRKFGVEVFVDTNNGNLIFLCETGNLAVTRGPKDLQTPTAKTKEPDWTHGLNIKARKFGEREFSDKTTVYGAEVFRENNLGVILYVGETGAIAAIKK
jgi:hypothetical protein